MAGNKARDRRVIGHPIGGDHPVGDILATMGLHPTRGALLGGIGVEQQRDHHPRLISGAAMTVLAVVGIELSQIHLLDGLDHKPRQMILRKPLAKRGWHQKSLLTITSNEVMGHGGIVSARPDRARGLCDSLDEKEARR